MPEWYTATGQARIVGAWPGAPIENVETLGMLLTIAKMQVLAYAPETVPTVFEPVTLTWPGGSTATLSREGDVVSAYVVPVPDDVGVMQVIPEPFGPVGNTTMYQFVAAPAMQSWGLVLNEDEGIGGPLGMTVVGGEAAVFEPATFRWLADPAEGTGVPANLVYAQLQHAKNLWAAGRADENGDIGTEGYSYVPRPLDKTIRNIIRPVQGGIEGGF